MKTFNTAALSASLCASTAITAVLTATPTAAQEQEEVMTEVIMVTAQKRAQNLQEVPLSITALSGEGLEDRNITDIERLELVTPGLTFGASGSDARPAIRGVRTEEVDVFNDPTVGFFVNGIYKPRTSQALAGFVDMERVEVLRGPQGTLFGRNTFGGSVNLIPNKAQLDDATASGVLQYGNFDHFRGEGVANMPLTDTLAIRVAAAFEQSDGYVNVLPSRVDDGTATNFNDRDQFFVRGSAHFEPNDAFTADLFVSRWDREGFGAGGFGYTTVGTLRNADGVTDLAGTLDRNNPRSRATPGVSDLGPYDVFRDTELTEEISETAVGLDLTYDFGNFAVRSITGYSDFSLSRDGDEDFSDTAGSLLTLDTESESFSQELQFISDFGGPVEFVAGFYYFDEEAVEDFVFFNLQSDGAPFSFGQEAETSSWAVYAQGDWEVTEQLTIVLGGRYTEDKKDFRFTTPSFVNNDSTTDESETFSKFTWRVGANYQITSDNLLYASASTGFRSGGFNNQFANTPAYGEQEVLAFEIGSKNDFPDYDLQLNVSAFYYDFDGLLSTEFVPISVDGVDSNVAARTNAGEAASFGFEVEAVYSPLENLRLDGAFTFLQAEYDDFFAGNPFVEATGFDVTPLGLNLNGNDIPYSPTFTFTLGAAYDIELENEAIITLAGNTYISDSFFLTEFNYDGGIDGRDVGRQSSYTKTDLRVRYTEAEQRYYIEAFVNNIENEAVLQRVVVGGQDAIFQSYGIPRTYGVKAGFSF